MGLELLVFGRVRFHPGERDYGVATPEGGVYVIWTGIYAFPSRRAGLWCCYFRARVSAGFCGRISFHPGERDYGVATKGGEDFPQMVRLCFHPGERDYGVATSDYTGRVSGRISASVSIPASGIMVLLPSIGVRKAAKRYYEFPSRRAGLWCCYDGGPSALREGFRVQYRFHPGERDYGVATWACGSTHPTPRFVSIPASGIMVLLHHQEV